MSIVAFYVVLHISGEDECFVYVFLSENPISSLSFSEHCYHIASNLNKSDYNGSNDIAFYIDIDLTKHRSFIF